MNAFRIGVTLSAPTSSEFNLERVVPIFHKWIQGQLLPGHLLIDVADYMHVEDGPGVVLVSHEANIGLEQRPGQCELVYLRKRPFGATLSGRVSTVLQSALTAASLLQSEIPELKFTTNHLQLRIVDKLNAPNDANTLAKVQPELEKILRKAFDSAVRLEHHRNELKPFELAIVTNSSMTLADLLQRASVAAV